MTIKRGLVANWMTREVVTVSPEVTLHNARRLMDLNSIRALPVMREGQLVGIITRRGLLRADPSSIPLAEAWEKHYPLDQETVEKIMSMPAITIDEDAPVGKAARVMLENKIAALPVLNDRRALTGILTSSDLFRLVIEEMQNEAQHITVKQWMTPDPETITPETTLLEAHRLMGVKRIRALPVIEGNQLVGIVTRTDVMGADPSRLYTRGAQEESREVVQQPVRLIMTAPVKTITEDDSMVEAARMMKTHKFHSLPVINPDGHMTGILTETDIFHLIVHKGW
ncbi:MAG: CBS domain-containing protein [Anaerolineae bacterium]